MSRAGIGKALACLHPHSGWLGDRGSANPEPVIGAVVFTHRKMPWGALLMLYSDLDHETFAAWLQSDDAAPMSLKALRDQTYLKVQREATRRHEEVHYAETLLESRAMDLQCDKIRGRPAEVIMRSARHAHADAKDNDWPRCRGDVMGSIADGVLAEMHVDERCPDCGGSGIMPYVLDEQRCQVPCRACYGTTYTRWSDRQRARECNITWSQYNRQWRRPYEWLYGKAMAERTAAVREFRAQLKE